MKVLIIGGTGVISRAITRELLARGYDITLFNRGTRTLPFASDVRQMTGDRADMAAFRQRMHAASFDAVIDMIAYTPEDARSTVETFAGRVQHIIMCSTCMVYQRPFRSVPIREDDEVMWQRPADTFPRAWRKVEMEHYLRGLMAEGMPITIIRPSYTLGEGTTGFGILRQNYGVADRILRGKPVLMNGDGNHPWAYTFAPDLALAFAGALCNPATYGQHYHATSDERTVWKDAYVALGRILGREPRFFHLPSEVLAHAAPAMCAHLVFDKSHTGLFDNTKIRRDIPDFRPRISLQEGMRALLDGYEAEGRVVDPVKDALEDRLHAAHEDLMRQLANIHPD